MRNRRKSGGRVRRMKKSGGISTVGQSKRSGGPIPAQTNKALGRAAFA